jgi:hypothetical protein
MVFIFSSYRFFLPISAELINAYLVLPEIKNPKADGKQLLEAVGDRLVME